MNDYISANRKLWDTKVAHHVASDFYDVAGFLKGANPLNDIELALLGDVKGKRILHLQCHFGQDSIALARLGASVTGVDFSEKAIEKAKQLATEVGEEKASFICCNIYNLKEHLLPQPLQRRGDYFEEGAVVGVELFDIVFTSYGTIGWLDNLDAWANIVSTYLKPGGKFVFAEFHPVVWMFDNDFERVEYRYFKSEPIVEVETGTYADKNAPITTTSITWNHGIGEVFAALIANGLSVKTFQEFDYSPYNCFNKTIEIAPRKYQIEALGNKIPMVYAMMAMK
jgi:SAM-dependent methyltransferase